MTDQQFEVVRLNLAPGSLWWHCFMEKGTRRRVGPYKVIGVCKELRRTHAEAVVFQSAAGGRLWSACLYDWTQAFEPYEEPAPPRTPDKPPPEKVLDLTVRGSGA